MSQKSGYLSKQLLIWVFAHVLGFGVLGISLLAIPAIMSNSNIVATTLIISLPISLAQWIALQRILQTSKLWILTIPIGLFLASLINRIIPDGMPIGDDESIVVLTVLYFVIGISIGLPQWLILRRQLLKASIWVLGSSVGVAGAFWFILATDLINQSGILSYIVGGLIYPIVTGLTILWLIVVNKQFPTNLVNAT